jgi:ABC-2 type transport system ATP-binding protein
MTTSVSVHKVSKSFGDVVALTEITCDIDTGLTAVLGPNGAGKSTLIRLMCGMASPDDGTVRVLGVDPRTTPAIYRRIGLVPQQERVLEHLTPLEFVRSAALLHGIADADRAAHTALATVQLDPDDQRDVGQYSKGMRQRVKLAQALVHDPELLILDEPLNGLDPRQRTHAIEIFRGLAAEGRTVLVSSHVLDEVERFGSRILLLARGRVAAEGDFHAIRNLMDDRPHRIAIMTSDPRRLAAHLLDAGVVDGARLGMETGELLVDTTTAADLRMQIAGLARDADVRLQAFRPLDDDLESVFRYLVGGR